MIGFVCGDKAGETRAIFFKCADKTNKIIRINHSINYDRKSNDFISNTKTYALQRDVDVTDKVIDVIYAYQEFLRSDMCYDVTDDTLIFFNYQTQIPYSDTALRKLFYKYCDDAGVPRIRMYNLRHTYVAEK